MKVVDVARGLARLESEGVRTGTVRLEGDRFALLRVAPGERHEAEPGTRAVLILDGHATFRLEGRAGGRAAGVRQTLGSGHLLLLEPGEALAVSGDGPAPLTALVEVGEALPPDDMETSR